MEKNSRKLRSLLRFDLPPQEYELLETEQGSPNRLWGNQQVPTEREMPVRFVSPTLAENERRLRTECRTEINRDLIIRKFTVGGSCMAMLAFVEGLVNTQLISDFVLRQSLAAEPIPEHVHDRVQYVIEHVLAVQDAQPDEDFDQAKKAILEGRSALFLEGADRAIIMETRGFPGRSVGTPQNETAILGPHEAFTENIRTNVTLIRRIVRTDDLVCEFRSAGGRNNCLIGILYREGIANRTLVNEVKRRLASVDTLLVLSTGMLEQLAGEHGYSPVPQTLETERPDRAAAALMQGQVTVLFDGNPMAAIMPVTLFSLLSSPEDLYLRPMAGSVVRVARYLGAAASILLPAVFVALTLHHQGMLSSQILATVLSSRQMVYLPLPAELLLMQMMFQLIRQAGLNVPGALGQSVGIIGGLIMGQAAVAANVVSTVVLIVVALSGLGNFAIPDYRLQLASFYLRIVLVLFAWAGGLMGLSCAILVLMAWLASLKSYGVPFLSPVAPRTYSAGPMFLRGRLQQHRRPTDYTNTIGRERA